MLISVERGIETINIQNKVVVLKMERLKINGPRIHAKGINKKSGSLKNKETIPLTKKQGMQFEVFYVLTKFALSLLSIIN